MEQKKLHMNDRKCQLVDFNTKMALNYLEEDMLRKGKYAIISQQVNHVLQIVLDIHI